MLTPIQSDALKAELKEEQKKAMKTILHHAALALDENKYNLFKKIVFNNFGKSGLETVVDKTVKKYTDEV